MDQLAETSLVELAKAGDQHAFAELYNRYFDPVYDFVSRMTRNRDEAADIAQDTFLKAMNALGGLQKGASFKSWIFTIARNTALNRLEKASRTRPLTFEDNEGDEVSFDVVDTDRFSDPEEAAQAAAIASLVWEAAAGLDPKQLSLLDLHLRQGLDSGEIADVLGVTKNNGYVMLNRLKKAVEEAIGAFIMFKSGRQYCESLDAVLSKADIRGMSPETRKLVERHVAQCPDCEERKRKLAPLAAFAAFGAIGSPVGARAHILEGLMQQWPGPAAGGGPAGSGAGGGSTPRGGAGAGGAGGAGRSFLKVGSGLAVLAAFLVALLFLPQSPIALTRNDGSTVKLADAGPGAVVQPGERRSEVWPADPEHVQGHLHETQVGRVRRSINGPHLHQRVGRGLERECLLEVSSRGRPMHVDEEFRSHVRQAQVGSMRTEEEA
ncbi:MAG: sigma-70 family RNA polymerase sigma factor, partial [Dehalococcoidia bacterium]|nr:sigma-70 family RNA polymerase sigma factor [Dehalococcoidia bacterium]